MGEARAAHARPRAGAVLHGTAQDSVHCLRDIRNNNADFLLPHSESSFKFSVFDLSPIMMVDHWEKSMYRVEALVRSTSDITTFKNLRGKKACFPEFGVIGTALCKGDSGGGLVFAKTEGPLRRHYLRGVASTAPNNGKKCNTHAVPMFTHILAHEHFIKDHLNLTNK
ncbi:hypothetical protein EVAR_53650_1 [Eumeta japonica]|uniref:Peptidase S1 domain-containing protein n=1 Tax=Eumeta variegata TaxID=151549 RepID=A0A4C1YPT0_EUMVA|nr:hypothetical protein EVAR_53650_1 [Eumeta japonica]